MSHCDDRRFIKNLLIFPTQPLYQIKGNDRITHSFLKLKTKTYYHDSQIPLGCFLAELFEAIVSREKEFNCKKCIYNYQCTL